MITVKNVGSIETSGASNKDTNLSKVFGDQGTVRVSYENREYVFGPNNERSLEDGIALNLIAQDSRLRAVGTREASVIGNASLTLRT
jgi:hypothetical protein